MIVTAGKTNVTAYFYIVGDASNASPGEPVTGLLFSDIETGGSASYARQGAARVDLTLITLASASAAHADGGFILVDDTNMPGVYRCDYPDAAFATGVDEVSLQIVVASGKNAVAVPIKVQITDVDFRDSVSGGMTALSDIESSLVIAKSDTAAIEVKASDTHSRLVVVEAAIDSDQTSRTTAVSDVHSRVVVVESSVDSDQTSRTAAISDVKSRLVVVESSIDSDTASAATLAASMASSVEVIETKASDTHSRLVVVEASIDSDQTSRATAISDAKSRLVVVESAIDSDQTSRATAISDVKSQLVVVASDTTRVELALVTATGALEGTPSSTVLQTDLSEATDNHYNNMVFVMTSGDEAGETRRILDYTGATGTITLSTPLSGSPTAAETFAILNIPVSVEPGDIAALLSDAAAIEIKTSDTHSRLVVVEAAIDSDTASAATIAASMSSSVEVIETKASDTHSRLVVVESSIDSDQTSRATAISDVKSRLVVVESAIDSDQTSRTAAISDVHSRLVVVELAIDSDTASAATIVASMSSSVEAIEAGGGSLTAAQDSKLTRVQSDVILVEAKASDTHSRLVVVESAIDSDTASAATIAASMSSSVEVIETKASDTHSRLVVVEAAIDSDQTSRTTAVSDVHSRIVVVESSIDSDQTSRTTAISDVKSALTVAASDVALLFAAHAEPTGVPAANETIVDKIAYNFAALRNKVTVTSTKKQFFDDADSALWEKDLSDDGTIFTETEGNAP